MDRRRAGIALVRVPDRETPAVYTTWIGPAGRADSDIRDTRPRSSAIRSSALEVWTTLVQGDTGQQIMQYELTIWALRTPGMAHLARWQYELYVETITATWTNAAQRAGVSLAVPADALARLFLAGIDGLILQYLTLGDADRAKADLETLVHQFVGYATT